MKHIAPPEMHINVAGWLSEAELDIEQRPATEDASDDDVVRLVAMEAAARRAAPSGSARRAWLRKLSAVFSKVRLGDGFGLGNYPKLGDPTPL